MEQWAKFNEMKSLSKDQKREIKYKLLPILFHEKMESLEQNWDEMDEVHFLAEAQKCETADHCERCKANEKKDKEKSKRKRESTKGDEDSVSSLSRSQASSNCSNKHQKGNGNTTSQGKAQECELCKLAGAPDFVYKTHFTNQCNKKDQYSKALSGGTGQREKIKREYKSMEKKLKKELNMVQKKLACKKQVTSSDSDDDSMESIE